LHRFHFFVVPPPAQGGEGKSHVVVASIITLTFANA
jgi:hypothetical protein